MSSRTLRSRDAQTAPGRAPRDARQVFNALMPPALRGAALDLPMRLQSLPARTPLPAPGSLEPEVQIVESGWVGTRAAVSDRMRPLCHLSIRGDTVGLSGLASAPGGPPADGAASAEQHITLTACELVSVPLSALRRLVDTDAGWRHFVLSELVRQLRTHHLMHAVTGGMVAPDRLIHFLYLMLVRHRGATQSTTARLPMPLTQGEIGEVLGLTNVSVNRAFRTLEGKEMLESARDSVTLLREASWVADLKLAHPPDTLGRHYGRIIG